MLAAWLRLARIALLPTVAWDVAAGLLLAGLPLDGRAAAAGACALLIYHAGMVLNDFADRRADAADRPGRPIPAGKVAPAAALLVAAAMLGAANALAALTLSAEALQICLALTAIVLLYDLGGPLVRRSAGPMLLALARMGSLNLGLAAHGDLLHRFHDATLQLSFSYAVWILFTARLAAGEENGAPGLRGLQYAFGAALAPIVMLVGQPVHWAFYPAWALVAARVLQPAVRDRGHFWAPERVQAAVRLLLGSAPLCAGLALLAAGQFLAAAVALLVSMAVRFLARWFPPE